MAGAGAGIVAMSATYPLDMVRGRLTVQEGRNVQYKGILHATRTILKEVWATQQQRSERSAAAAAGRGRQGARDGAGRPPPLAGRSGRRATHCALGC